MAINAIQAAIRSMTGTERQFSGDLHAYWDQLGIPPGQFAERMVAWKQLPQNAAWIAATEDADAPEVVDGLWRNGEQGVWYDAGDLSTMYQDAAGTLPVYAPGQGQVDPPVGRILDKSGRGNHAYQATTTSRPTLSARYNLLTATEGLASAPWTINGTCTRTDAFATAPDGTLTATRIQLGTLATDEVRQTFSTSAGAGIGYTASIWLKSNTGNDQQVRLKNTHINVIDNFLTVTVTSDWQRFSLTVTNGASAGTGQLLGVTNTAGDLPKDILVCGADLRVANDGIGLPPYQRVVDASNYDTAGFPLYLKFDGVDDWLQTASVDFSGTDKITLACSARKQADTSVGELLGFSATPNLSAGGFGVLAPPSATPRLEVSVCGTTNGYVHVHSAAPETGVYVARLNLSVAGVADGKVSVRKNGVVVIPLQIGPGAGTGNFGNYPLYIGRRGGSSLPFNGRLYGLIICGAATPDTTIAKVERYLNQKAKVF